MPAIPLVLLFGPSGVGKSTLGAAVARTLGWLHVELDAPPEDREPAAIQVEKSLGRALSSGRFDAFASDLVQLAGSSHAGVIVSFMSIDCPPIADIRVHRACGIHSIYLFGTEEQCLQAFREREAATGRNLPVEYWHARNGKLYAICRHPDYEPHKLLAFRGGVRRPVEDVVAELLLRTAIVA